MHTSNALPQALGLATLTALAIGLVVAARAPHASRTTSRASTSHVASTTLAHERLMVPVTSSQPSLGPRDALVTLVLWSDLRGRAARDMDAALRHALDTNNDVRLVYRHQLDRRDPNAVRLHQVAHAVHYHADRFWALRQKLLTREASAIDDADLTLLVESVGVPWSVIAGAWQRQGTAQHVAADQVFGHRFGVGSSPALFVNGRRLTDTHVSLGSRIQQAIDEERAMARRVLAQGVARADVYETLTRGGAWNARNDLTSPTQARQGL